ncbi:MAG: GNAT family N-acetyltransferase, partial [Flavobacteriales bacterium]
MSHTIEPVRTDDASIAAMTALLRQVFPNAAHFTEEVVRWQYRENPDGEAVGFNAWNGTELAAHYVTIPLLARVNDKEERGLLSLNTATHPSHQGKGLFTKLANATYEAAATQGFGFVIGVANANSTHGFTKKLGFQLVSPLCAMIGCGPLAFDHPDRIQYEHSWSDAA